MLKKILATVTAFAVGVSLFVGMPSFEAKATEINGNQKTTEIVETTGSNEIKESTEVNENVESNEIKESTESTEIKESTESTEIKESTESVETIENTTAIENNEIPEVVETVENNDLTDMDEIVGNFEGAEITERIFEPGSEKPEETENVSTYASTYNLTIKKGETYEISNITTGSINIGTSATYASGILYDLIGYSSNGDVFTYYLNDYGTIYTASGYKYKVTALNGNITLTLPTSIQSAVKKSTTPAFYKFTMKKGETYEVKNTTNSESRVINGTRNNINSLDYVFYNSNNEIINSDGNVPYSIYFDPGVKAKFTLGSGESTTIALPYELKSTLTKVSTPAVQRVNIKNGETYEINNSRFENFTINHSASKERFDSICYEADGTMYDSDYNTTTLFRLRSKGKSKITVTSGSSVTFYMPYELRNDYKKVTTPVFFKNVLTPGYTYKFKNISTSTTYIHNTSSSSGTKYSVKIYEPNGSLYSQSASTYGYQYIRPGYTCEISIASGTKLDIFTPYDLRNGISTQYIDIGNHFGKKEINWFVTKGYLDTTQSYFRPGDSITRAEFIKMVNQVFGYKTKATSMPYNDVSSSNWYYNEVLAAVKAGYISTSNKSFRPNDPITREEVANIITTITNTKDRNLDKLSTYTDKNQVSPSAQSSVEGAIEQGFMGQGSKTFNPKKNITRGESVVTLHRVANR